MGSKSNMINYLCQICYLKIGGKRTSEFNKNNNSYNNKTKDHDISEELEKKIGSITLSFSQNFTINKLKNLGRKNPDNANTNIAYYY